MTLLALAALFCSLAAPVVAAEAGSFPVTIRVHADRSLGQLKPIWRFFGADEPNYAYMKDGERLLEELGSLRRGEVYFRAHNLLTSGDGTPALKWGSTNVYTRDSAGRAAYDWSIVDRIFDAYAARQVVPYVELGFMPKALSRQPEPHRHEWRPGFAYAGIFTGWRMPPKDYADWGDLVERLARHGVERYGAASVEKWYWETWNEANTGYWGGTPEEFLRLHDYAVAGVRRALPGARVGGPHTAGDGGDFTRGFFEHCLRGINAVTGQSGTPIDFVSFHAKGSPVSIGAHVRMGIAAQLATIDRGFGIVASFPELCRTPIVIGESDPEGCAACQGPQFAYRNGTMYSSYTAASFAREHDLAVRHGVNLQGAVTWAFEFEDQPYFAGFRALATNGIALPVLNVFRAFSRMERARVAVESTGAVPLDVILKDGVRGTPDVSAIASSGAGRLTILVWHYHDDELAGPAAAVELRASGLGIEGGEARLTHYRIDEAHSNAYAEWKRMGSPVAPSEQQYAALPEASRFAPLRDAPARIAIRDGSASLRFDLPRQGVSLLVLDWVR
jgi:xylan 1,4-beta-xylosidase